MTDSNQQEYLDVEGFAARYPGVTPATVYSWLHKGTAPRSLKIGKRRFFRLADVIAWEDERADDRSADAVA